MQLSDVLQFSHNDFWFSDWVL